MKRSTACGARLTPGRSAGCIGRHNCATHCRGPKQWSHKEYPMPVYPSRPGPPARGLTVAALLLAPAPLDAAPPTLVPTNDPNAFAFPAPPSNFDPIHATAADLAAYGFPPRPKL